MQFKEVIGQEYLKQKLIEEVQHDRISHAQLFLGPEGCGNLTLALAYAQYINCENKQESDSCGVCSSCLKASKLIHPDIHYAFPVISKKPGKASISNDFINEWRTFIEEGTYQNVYQWLQHIQADNKQGNITVDECREIIRKLSLKTYEGKNKIMIIWMPEYLGHIGNVLLKIIEEPTDDTIFLLVAEDMDKILNTIISRTQLIKVPPIADHAIEAKINKSFNFDSNEAKRIAYLSDGNYREALEIIQEESNINAGVLKEWLNGCYKKNHIAITNWVDEIAREGREKQKNFLKYLTFILRESIILPFDQDKTLQRSGGEEAKMAQTINQLLGIENTYQFVKEIDKAHARIERNANPKILFLNLSIHLSKRLRAKAL